MKEFEERKMKSEVLGEVLNGLMDCFLDSSAPEEMKNEVMLMKKETQLSTKTNKIVSYLLQDKSNSIANKTEIVRELNLVFTSFIERLEDLVLSNNLKIQ